ncbi:hypothetical protein, partial [Paenibacillus jamilae]|uniref:hypothetical protein n=1 Tax=Paenibacillus jamilae TaxID=114136 RepID=UPI001E42B917
SVSIKWGLDQLAQGFVFYTPHIIAGLFTFTRVALIAGSQRSRQNCSGEAQRLPLSPDSNLKC